MRILLLCSVYPPDIIGGAEVAASHLAKWLVRQGHDVGVLCTAGSATEASWGDEIDGVRIYRPLMPRPYPALRAATAAPWLKPIWHLQDHLDLRNEWLLKKTLDEFKPDIVNVHIAQGLGHNMMSELARSRVATVYTLHDLGLACINASMFKGGRNCERQEIGCVVASKLKWRWLDSIERLSFWSPSKAVLEKLGQFVPLSSKRLAVIPYPLAYKYAASERRASPKKRLLYLGRIHATKGVVFLLKILAELAHGREFELLLAGTGPLEPELKSKYLDSKWCQWLGFVDQMRITELLKTTDALCVPSMWDEPYGIVLIQALMSGVPIIASRKGAIPEIVDDGVTGLLCEAGSREEWSFAISRLLDDDCELSRLKAASKTAAQRFDQDKLGERVLELFAHTIDGA
jgi:glycosyltransferase involved in cell wall biosynthesis